MKDHRFIELINLYIDRQITADETAELEAEIQRNPRRRAVYRQYCQMHRATTLVLESFRTPVAGQQSTRSTIAEFEHRRRGRNYRWIHYAGGLAAAACLALIFVRLNEPSSDSTAVVPLAAVAPRAAQVAIAAAQTQPAALPGRQMVAPGADLVSLRQAVADADYTALLATLHREEQRSGPAPTGRLPSLFDDGVFDSRQAFPVTNQRVYFSRQTPAQQAEFTAFQFQR